MSATDAVRILAAWSINLRAAGETILPASFRRPSRRSFCRLPCAPEKPAGE
jgi:hypothetical protein